MAAQPPPTVGRIRVGDKLRDKSLILRPNILGLALRCRLRSGKKDVGDVGLLLLPRP